MFLICIPQSEIFTIQWFPSTFHHSFPLFTQQFSAVFLPLFFHIPNLISHIPCKTNHFDIWSIARVNRQSIERRIVIVQCCVHPKREQESFRKSRIRSCISFPDFFLHFSLIHRTATVSSNHVHEDVESHLWHKSFCLVQTLPTATIDEMMRWAAASPSTTAVRATLETVETHSFRWHEFHLRPAHSRITTSKFWSKQDWNEVAADEIEAKEGGLTSTYLLLVEFLLNLSLSQQLTC